MAICNPPILYFTIWCGAKMSMSAKRIYYYSYYYILIIHLVTKHDVYIKSRSYHFVCLATDQFIFGGGTGFTDAWLIFNRFVGDSNASTFTARLDGDKGDGKPPFVWYVLEGTIFFGVTGILFSLSSTFITTVFLGTNTLVSYTRESYPSLV